MNANPSYSVDITILITCYNEQELITDTLDHVLEALKTVGLIYEILVIDDCSRDASVERLRAYMEAHPAEPITLIVNPNNRGLANNYVEAAFRGKGTYYRLCCGDDSEPVDALVGLFRHVGKADIIVAYQKQDLVVGKSDTRKILSKTFTALVNFISGYQLIYYNGMAIHRRYNVMRWHPSSYGFGFQADILTRLLDEGNSYMQVASKGIDRKKGHSTALSMRNVLSVTHTLLELLIRRVRRMIYGSTMPKPLELFPD